MAQGFLQSFDKKIIVCSAGIDPASKINAKAIAVMKEAGIDISHNKPKPVEKYLDEVWDYVVTVCDDAKETCPVFQGKVIHRLHISFDDPSYFSGSEEEIINEFRRIRDKIKDTFYRFYRETLS
jgi:arsenate reductase